MPGHHGPSDEDAQTIAALDTEFQAAVAIHDVVTMDRILAEDAVLVTGRGDVFTKRDQLAEAKAARVVYERQEEVEQVVRVRGDVGVVTALLWAKGTKDHEPFEYRLWFSDTYVRTIDGWRYYFGQASLPLPTS